MQLLIENFCDTMKCNGASYWRNPNLASSFHDAIVPAIEPKLASSCALQLCSILSYPTQLPGHCYLHPHGWKEEPIIFWHNLPALCLQQQFISTMEKKVKCYQVLNEVHYENVLDQESVCYKLHFAISPPILRRFSRSQWLRKALEKTFRSILVTSWGNQ